MDVNQYKKLNWFQKWLVIPPPELRPAQAPWINSFAMGGYDPNNTESYVLLRCLFLALHLNLVAMIIYALPVLGFDLIWLGFPQEQPVQYFIDTYPMTVFPLVVVACIAYTYFLIWRHRNLCQWDFVSFRQQFAINTQKLVSKKMGAFKWYIIMIFLIGTGLILGLYSDMFIQFLRNYKLVTDNYDFGQQNIGNFVVVAILYIFACGVLIPNAIILGLVNLVQAITGRHPYLNHLRSTHKNTGANS